VHPIVLFISGGGSLSGLLVAALLLARRDGNRRAPRVLSALMLLFSLGIVHPILSVAWPPASRLHMVLLVEPFQFLIAPIIGAYFRVLLLPGISLRPRHFLHALPFVLLGVFGLLPLPSSEPLETSARIPVITGWLWALLVVQAFLYLIPSLRLLHRYRRSLPDQESNLAGIDLGWLMWFSQLFLALYVSYAVILVIMIRGPYSFPVRGSLSIALSVLVFLIGYRGLLQRETPAVEDLEARSPRVQEKYQKTSIPADEVEELKTRLVRAMETEKLYLDPELRLSDLVERLHATRNQLSYVINQRFGKNFYNFVNEYRVGEVLRLMDEGSYEDKKILALAFDSGFNSKPAFNLVFKKQTGLTPSEYWRGKKKKV